MPKSVKTEVTLDELRKIAEQAKTSRKKPQATKRKSFSRVPIIKERKRIRRELDETFDQEADLIIRSVLEKLKTSAKRPVRVKGIGLVAKAKVEIAIAYPVDRDFMSPCTLQQDDSILICNISGRIKERKADNPIKLELGVERIGSCDHHYLEARANLEK